MSRRRGLYVVLAAFVASQVGYAAAGLRMDVSALHPANVLQVQWQLLPLNLLRHDLAQSVWNLNSQPPLYNLFCGLLLHLPAGWQAPAATAVFTALALVLAVTTYLLLVELRVKVTVALVVTLFVLADPAVVLYQDWLSWSYPTAVALTAGAYGMARWASRRTRSAGWAAVALSCFAAALLIDTTFQWPWLLAMAAIAVALAGRRARRAAAVAVAVPVLVVGGWYAKGALQFGTTATSSWLGMNLYQTTLAHAPPGELSRLIADGTVNGLAAVPPFAPVGTYSPRFAVARHTGVPALDQRSGPLGVPNFNNSVYVAVSERYLGDDLAYIEARPGRYARTVTRAARLWSIPADQYLWSGSNFRHLGGYARVYDTGVLLQPRSAVQRLTLASVTAPAGPSPSQMSWTVVALTVVDLLVAPLAVWRRRADRAWAAAVAALWLTVGYSFVVTSTTEAAENMRFRFELGTLPVVLAVTVLCSMRLLPSSE